uniref:protein ALP1-like n=1 Tax=Erigeron canadensis TaxID=72917 RepID=UPI001CB8AFC2|nr:protein ALP1-like [Erigeron canadensis]
MDLNNPLSSSESSTDSSSDSSSGSSEVDAAISKVAILAVNAMLDAVRGDDDNDDDADDEVVRPRFKRQTTIVRRRQEDEARLMRNYFVDEPIYNAKMFRRRYRMSKRLFLQIFDDLAAEYPFFQQRYDGSGKLGFSTKLKCTSTLRQLAYGTSVDAFDENFGISERTSRDTLEHFCTGIRELYGSTYLCRPTWSDLQRIYEVHEQSHGFPGMIGSIDCMHWTWDMCPNAWRGTHTRGDIGKPSLILQAVASYDLWIWNAYFGMQGSNNDINVFEASPVLEELISGLAPTPSFYANDNFYKAGYYLGDGIYPEYAIFVKTFTDPIDNKRKLFKKKQESARKDIERAFGVLKKRWNVISNPARYWDKDKMQSVIYTCIILHNMILQDKNKAFCQNYDLED